MYVTKIKYGAVRSFTCYVSLYSLHKMGQRRPQFLSTQNRFNVVKCLVLDHYSEIEIVFDNDFDSMLGKFEMW